MTDLTIPIDDVLWRRLNEIARQRNETVAEVAIQALSIYLEPAAPQKRSRYSFVGIGRSGYGQASARAEEILRQGVHRESGWGRSA